MVALGDCVFALTFSAIVVLILVALDYIDVKGTVTSPSIQRIGILLAVSAVSIVVLERLTIGTKLGRSFKDNPLLFMVSSALASGCVIFYLGLFGFQPRLKELITGKSTVRIVDEQPGHSKVAPHAHVHSA